MDSDWWGLRTEKVVHFLAENNCFVSFVKSLCKQIKSPSINALVNFCKCIHWNLIKKIQSLLKNHLITSIKFKVFLVIDKIIWRKPLKAKTVFHPRIPVTVILVMKAPFEPHANNGSICAHSQMQRSYVYICVLCARPLCGQCANNIIQAS